LLSIGFPGLGDKAFVFYDIPASFPSFPQWSFVFIDIPALFLELGRIPFHSSAAGFGVRQVSAAMWRRTLGLRPPPASSEINAFVFNRIPCFAP
jgi:hypothetical protein